MTLASAARIVRRIATDRNPIVDAVIAHFRDRPHGYALPNDAWRATFGVDFREHLARASQRDLGRGGVFVRRVEKALVVVSDDDWARYCIAEGGKGGRKRKRWSQRAEQVVALGRIGAETQSMCAQFLLLCQAEVRAHIAAAKEIKRVVGANEQLPPPDEFFARVR